MGEEDEQECSGCCEPEGEILDSFCATCRAPDQASSIPTRPDGSPLRLLELFSGTGSVGKVAEEMGIEVVSLDDMSVTGLPQPTIAEDIMKWNYKQFDSDHFDIVWASPVCSSFSSMRFSMIGRTVNGETMTREQFEQDIIDYGLPLLDKVLEIIAYFQPNKFFIENPETGKMKQYLAGPHTVVSYFSYGMAWEKPTRIWHNLQKFKPKVSKSKAGPEGSEALQAAKKRDKAVIPSKLIEHLFKQMVCIFFVVVLTFFLRSPSGTLKSPSNSNASILRLESSLSLRCVSSFVFS